MASFDWSILWRTLQVTGAALFLSTLLGVPLGTWLGLNRFRGQRLLIGFVHTGMGFPPVVVGLVVYLALSRSGPLASLDWLFTPQAMILAQTIIATPLVAGITTAAVAAAPAELVPQVRSLGADPWQAKWAVLREARMVGGDIQGQTRVLTTAIVLETRQGAFAVALALGGWLVGLALLVNLVGLRLQGRTSS
jgi:tungstate transport system permease protein